MKKLLALILCLSMFLGSAAIAEEVELNKNVMEGKTDISMTIDHDDNNFVVVIPASVTIDTDKKEGSFDIVLKSGWKLVSSNGLRVRVKEFANGVATHATYNAFTLKNAEGKTVKYEIDYVKGSGGSTNYLTGSSYNTVDLIAVAKGNTNTADKKTTLKLRVPTLPTDPGVYTDTITFAITLY